MMDEYRDNQVKKLMMKRRKKKRIKVIRLFFVLGIIGFVFFILLSDIMKIKTIIPAVKMNARLFIFNLGIFNLDIFIILSPHIFLSPLSYTRTSHNSIYFRSNGKK